MCQKEVGYDSTQDINREELFESRFPHKITRKQTQLTLLTRDRSLFHTASELLQGQQCMQNQQKQ